MMMNNFRNGEEAFDAVRTLGSKIGWTKQFGHSGRKVAQTNPVKLPELDVTEGYESGSAYARLYATSLVEYGYDGIVHAIRGVSIGAERGFDMDTAIFEQVEIDDLVPPDEQTLEAIAKWVTRLSELIDQK